MSYLPSGDFEYLNRAIILMLAYAHCMFYYFQFQWRTLRGFDGSLEPPSRNKLYQFHGENYEKSGRMLKTNPLLMGLIRPSRNPGSASEFVCGRHRITQKILIKMEIGFLYLEI